MSMIAQTQPHTVTDIRQPTPQHFFETLNGYQRTAALKAALELDLFTAIAERANTAAALAQRCQASVRGMRILCDYLVVIGFLNKQGNFYSLTLDTAAFLNRNSPAYLGTAIGFLAAPPLIDNFKDLTAAVRKGGPVAGSTLFGPAHTIWVEFARRMAPVMALPAELLALRVGAGCGHPWKVLDVAAGHGLYGIRVAKHNPNAEIVAVDWPDVLAVARENAKLAGVDQRYSVIPGNAFEVEFGGDYDLVLITSFMHGFDEAICEGLLRKVHAALKPGGRAVVLEFIPNEDRVSPSFAASFSLTMLANTSGGKPTRSPNCNGCFATPVFFQANCMSCRPLFRGR